MDFFQEGLDKAHGERLVNAGSKSCNLIFMFKILTFQRYYKLSDIQIEHQILDRVSLCRFLGLILSDKVLDEKTVWSFRNKLIYKGLERELLDKITALLALYGLI